LAKLLEAKGSMSEDLPCNVSGGSDFEAEVDHLEG
jgi:hypothetical protein